MSADRLDRQRHAAAQTTAMRLSLCSALLADVWARKHGGVCLTMGACKPDTLGYSGGLWIVSATPAAHNGNGSNWHMPMTYDERWRARCSTPAGILRLLAARRGSCCVRGWQCGGAFAVRRKRGQHL